MCTYFKLVKIETMLKVQIQGGLHLTDTYEQTLVCVNRHAGCQLKLYPVHVFSSK